MRVLIIEDDANFARSIDLMLASNGRVCDCVGLGGDGVSMARLHNYDIIILDLVLPDMEGYEVVRQIRDDAVATPILILSGLAESVNKVTGLDLGADDYITKPFDRDELIARVEALVRRSMGYSATPPTGATRGVPTGALFARKGAAAPWTFRMAYTPYGPDASRIEAGDAIEPSGAPAAIPPRPRRVIKFRNAIDVAECSKPGENDATCEGADHAVAANTAVGVEEPAPAAAATPAPRSANAGCVIVLGDERPGAETPTNAAPLIRALLRDGHSVASIDLSARPAGLTRQQGSRGTAADARGLDAALPGLRVVELAEATREAIGKALQDCIDTHDYVVVITPGRDSLVSRVVGQWVAAPQAAKRPAPKRKTAAKRQAAPKRKTAATKRQAAGKPPTKHKTAGKRQAARKPAAKRKTAPKRKSTATKRQAVRKPAAKRKRPAQRTKVANRKRANNLRASARPERL